MNWSRKKTAVTAAALIAAVYAGGVSYFTGHTFPNTTVDGKNASMVTDTAVLEQVRADNIQGTLQVRVQDKEYTLNVPEVLSVADDSAVLGTVKGSRNPYAWPVEVFRSHEVASGRKFAFDTEAAGKLLDEQGLTKLEIEPVDAVLSEFSEENGYTVIPDADGWKGDRAAVLEAVKAAAEGESRDIDLTQQFAVKAAVLADDASLNGEVEELNALVNHDFRLLVGDAEQTLNGETLNSWLTETRDGRKGLDAVKIREYSEGLQEQMGDILQELQDKNGQRYIVDYETFTNILASRIGLDMPEPESSSAKQKREAANAKLKKQAEKDAKKADTEEEKAKILAEAEAKMTPEPEMVAVLAAPEEEQDVQAEKDAQANDGAKENSGAKAEKDAKPDASPANASSADAAKKEAEKKEAEKKDAEKSDAEAAEEKPDYTKAILYNGLFIENPVTEEAAAEAAELKKAEEEKKKAEEEKKKKAEEKKKAAEGTATGSDAEEAEAAAPEESGPEPLPTPVEVTMAENEIHIPLLEADPGFELGYGLNYVEVDIGNQHVTLYENCRKVMESACVTGIPNKARATHPGVFKIDYKQRNRILRGSQNLYASFVNYWMPFDGGIGLHDATWRGTFGGEIYKYSGSHGCVNLPLSFAKNLYAHVYPGETVYVHY